MLRLSGVLVVVALLAAGCGVRNSKPFTAAGTSSCLESHGFTGVTTDPNKVGLIAAFADNGGIYAVAPSGNTVTIAFEDDESSVPSTEQAFRQHAPKRRRAHISDLMVSNRNAVLVWNVTPDPSELDTATRCLKP